MIWCTYLPKYLFAICLDLNLPCTNNVCEINVCSGTFRWRSTYIQVLRRTNRVHRPCPPVINCGKSWLTNSHIQQRGSRCGLINGVVHLACCFVRSCFVVPKKVITAMSGKYCCWYCHCLVSHWALLVGMGIGMHSVHIVLKSLKDCNLWKRTLVASKSKMNVFWKKFEWSDSDNFKIHWFLASLW